MKLDEVKKIYLFDDNGRIQGFRAKTATPVSGTADVQAQ